MCPERTDLKWWAQQDSNLRPDGMRRSTMKKDTRDGSGLIVGVDLGDRWSRYCVLDQHGKVLEEDTVATTGRAFRKLFGDRPARGW